MYIYQDDAGPRGYHQCKVVIGAFGMDYDDLGSGRTIEASTGRHKNATAEQMNALAQRVVSGHETMMIAGSEGVGSLVEQAQTQALKHDAEGKTVSAFSNEVNPGKLNSRVNEVCVATAVSGVTTTSVSRTTWIATTGDASVTSENVFLKNAS